MKRFTQNGPWVSNQSPKGWSKAPSYHLHIVIEEDLRGVDRRAERGARIAWTERGGKGAFERQPVIEAIEYERAEVDRVRILARLAVIDEIGGRAAGEGELSRAPVAAEPSGDLRLRRPGRHLGLDLFQLFVSFGLQLLIAVLKLLGSGLKSLIGGADLAVLRFHLVELLFEVFD